MSARQLTEDVKESVGPAKPEDQSELVDPLDHKTRYEATLPGLGEILGRSEILAVAERYHDATASAAWNQRRFKRHSSGAASAIVAAAAASASLVALGILVPGAEPADDALRQALGAVFGLVGIVSGAAASVLLSIIKGSNFLGQWMTERAEAESARLEYFAEVTAAKPDPALDDVARTSLAQLEYFRRYQLEGQERFYHERGEMHRRDAQKAIVGGAIWIGAAGCMTAGAGMLVTISAKLLAVGALGVVAQAMASKLTGAEAMSQDARNAERYRRTRRALVDLLKLLDEVREALSAGDRESMKEFVATVHSQLSLENRQWLEVQKGSREELGRLQQRLKKVRESRVDGAPTPAA